MRHGRPVRGVATDHEGGCGRWPLRHQPRGEGSGVQGDGQQSWPRPAPRLRLAGWLRPPAVAAFAPAQRSHAAHTKASPQTDPEGQPVRSFQSSLTHLATLTRNDIRYGTDPNLPTVPTLTATTTQRRAFELLHATIPLTLT